MTSRTVRNGDGHQFPGGLKEIVISCDHMSCTKAVNDTTIREGGGLKEMGWQTLSLDGHMRHYCPEHKRSEGVTE